jgi:UrcA family protein
MQIVRFALVAAAFIAAPVLAEPAGYERWQVNVQTADLDLKSQAGQRKLDRRMEAALVKLCGEPVFFSRDEMADLDACKAQARAAAAPQMKAAIARAGTDIAAK